MSITPDERIQGYLAALPSAARAGLTHIADAIRAAAPRAVDHFSYGMPGFLLDGQPLVWYAAWKKHYALYPIGAEIAQQHAPDLAHDSAKGTIKFPLESPPSAALIKRLVRARIAQLKQHPVAPV